MLVQIVNENGVKKMIPLTADAGAGNPVGTIIPMYKKSSPSGYLYCDGSTFDQTKYPLLYAYLGSNVLPDYREFALVGAEENTTDVYNASTNPTGTIQDHDVYTEGQAKDDQLQDHSHYIFEQGTSSDVWGVPNASSGWSKKSNWGKEARTIISDTGRSGTVTRGKRKAVYFYIKATSGLSENAQDNVVAQLNEERSYSTSEVNTGKKWIDGKPIYRKVFDLGAISANTNYTFNLGFSDWETVTHLSGMMYQPNTSVTMNSFPIPSTTPSGGYFFIGIRNDNKIDFRSSQSDYGGYKLKVTLEYTKTTD